MANFFDILGGSAGKEAANAAAADQYRKQQEAIAGIKGYGDQYKNEWANLAKPYDTGDSLQRLMYDPSSVRSLPGYGFAQSEGIRALDHSASARGMLNSGRNEKDIMRFSQGLADQSYGNQLARLMGMQNQYTNTAGTGLRGQLDTQALGFKGGMDAAGTIGQGQIAGANAEAAGAKNWLDLGMKGIGMLAGGMGGMPGMGAGGSSFMGSLMSPSGSNPFNSNGSRNTMAYG